MMLKKYVEEEKLIEDLRREARKLHDETVLHHVAYLMTDAADKLTEYVRKDIERG